MTFLRYDEDLACVRLSRDPPLQLECRLLLGSILLSYGLLVESEVALEELRREHGLAVVVLGEAAVDVDICWQV